MDRLKKLSWMLIIFFIANTCLISGCKEPTSKSAVINLRFSTVYQSWSPGLTEGILPWVKWIEKQSGGRVKFTIYYDQSALTVSEVLDGVKKRAVDMGEFRIDLYPGLFTLNSVTELPLLLDYPSSSSSGFVASALYNKYPELQSEFEGVKFLCWNGGGPGEIFTTGKQIKTADDLKGLRLSVSGAYSSAAIKALGATPVSFDPGEDYGALTKGFIDGIVGDYVFIKTVGFEPVLRYATEVGALSVTLDAYVMNLDVWNNLPADIQEIISASSQRYMEAQGLTMDNREKSDRTALESTFLQKGDPGIYILPDDQLDKWREVVTPVREMWMADATAKVGEAKAKAILDDAIKFTKLYDENYSAEYAERVIQEWITATQ